MKRKLFAKKTQRKPSLLRRLWFFFGVAAGVWLLLNFLSHRRHPVVLA
ncbi:MAG TPA: hypothetical protein VI547_09440 [Anaerolineales bacterium]|nr:hypothetical protein [Anaerolineales bacterium]HLF02185.1 hypothetical protein [Anaerolineales bacterium]